MDIFDIKNWFWQVAGNAANVFSSASGGYVPATALQYQAWLARGNAAPMVHSEEELFSYLRERAPDLVLTTSVGLAAYAARVRYSKEVGGITVNGFAVLTDRQSQAMINGAYNMAYRDATFVTQWKTASGMFVTLDALGMIAVATAVGAHVAACFARESSVAAGINAGTIKAPADIDAAFAAI